MSTISYPKIWNAGEILTAADLNAEFAAVNTITGITTGQLAPSAVTTTELADLSVTTGKLAVAASTRLGTSAAVTGGLSFSTVETTIVTLPALAPRGGIILFYGSWGLIFSATTTSAVTVTYRLYRGVTLLEVIDNHIQFTAGMSGAAIAAPALPVLSDQPVAGSYVYKITGQTNNASASLLTGASNPGIMFGVEFA